MAGSETERAGCPYRVNVSVRCHRSFVISSPLSISTDRALHRKMPCVMLAEELMVWSVELPTEGFQAAIDSFGLLSK